MKISFYDGGRCCMESEGEYRMLNPDQTFVLLLDLTHADDATGSLARHHILRRFWDVAKVEALRHLHEQGD